MSECKNFLLDLIFPRRCLGCDQLIDDCTEAQVCATCLTKIALRSDFVCAFCSAPVRLGKTCPFCASDHHLDRLLVTTDYDAPLVEKLLKTMKYRLVKSLADQCADLMIAYLKQKIIGKLDWSPWVVPVPLHWRRENERGFNQSEIIAQKIARYFDWPLKAGLLKRAQHHSPQADIKDRPARIKNMSGVFSCVQPATVVGKTVLLIDDVSTTGSTLDDCARALKGAGAGEVIGLVLARNR